MLERDNNKVPIKLKWNVLRCGYYIDLLIGLRATSTGGYDKQIQGDPHYMALHDTYSVKKCTRSALFVLVMQFLCLNKSDWIKISQGTTKYIKHINRRSDNDESSLVYKERVRVEG